MEKLFGIDISAHQGDFPLDVAISQGVQFVIVKGGGGDAGLYKDNKFERNYSLAKQLKIPVGSYFFSKAVNEDQALKEAEFYYNNCLKGKDFELPVYYDVEHRVQLNLDKETLTKIIIVFCNYIRQKGYIVGIYSSLSNFNNHFIDSKLSDYEHWVAQWSRNLSYSGRCGMWQFGGEVNLMRDVHIAGKIVDQDYMLYDYISESQKNKKEEKKMTVQEAINMVVATALSEVGYREKNSNYMLDDKTANAGSANYTKYARDLDAIEGFYNGLKQGYAYCDVFNDWVFVKCFGAELAKKMLYQPSYSAGAGCTYSMQYYITNNAFSKNAKVGSQIFFGSSYKSTHTGIVVEVNNNTVITVEGNTSDGVYKRSYNLNSSNIVGYGWPDYILVEQYNESSFNKVDYPNTQNITNDKITSIKNVQSFLNNNYLSLFKTKLVEDGQYGELTKQALVMSVQKELGTQITGVFSINDKNKFPILKNGKKGFIVRLVQCGLICFGLSVGSDGADGDYGNNTANAVKQFQRVKYLIIDGECGPETAYKLFN